MSQFLTKKLLEITHLVNQRMAELLPNNSSRLVLAARYSVLCKGKRIRPFLTIGVADIFGVDSKTALDIACTLEFIHIYSLIHDDLPAMDDDDFRRGEPTCHKQFDEATAILAGDALLTYAFEILSDQKLNISVEIRCRLINLIARAIGFEGMAGGQMLDLEAENKNLSPTEIFHLHHLKTGKMIIAAVEVGAILGNANAAHKQALINYATDIGLAFQIKDDILDFEEDKIQPRNKPDQASIVNIIGLEAAVFQLNQLEQNAVKHLEVFDDNLTGVALLKDLAGFIVRREA